MYNFNNLQMLSIISANTKHIITLFVQHSDKRVNNHQNTSKPSRNLSRVNFRGKSYGNISNLLFIRCSIPRSQFSVVTDIGSHWDASTQSTHQRWWSTTNRGVFQRRWRFCGTVRLAARLRINRCTVYK